MKLNKTDLPEGWKILKLNECCDVRDGTHDSPKYASKGIPLITSKNLRNGFIDFSNVNYISEENHIKFSKRSLVENGDIIFGMIGTIGNPVIVNSNIEFSVKNIALLKFKNATALNKFIYMLLQSNIILRQINSNANSGVQSFIGLNDIRNLKIPVPPIGEQERIAEILSCSDELIENNQSLLEQKRLLKKSLMQKLLSPKKSWKKVKLGDVFEFLKTSSYSRADTAKEGFAKYIHYGDIHSKYARIVTPSDISIHIKEELVKNYSNLKNGDLILVDASEDYEGTTKVIELKNIKEEYIISGLHTIALRDKSNTFADGFRAYITEIPLVKTEFLRMVVGFKVYGISKSSLKLIEIPFPPLKEQERIAKILSTADDEIFAMEKYIEELKSLKKALMQNLLTGKIRVKV